MIILEFSTILRRIMDSRGDKKGEFASACGISFSGLSGLLSGDRQPSYETLKKIAENLQISPAALFDYQPRTPGEFDLVPEDILPLLDEPRFIAYLQIAKQLFENDINPQDFAVFLSTSAILSKINQKTDKANRL